jgi:hypothetical protein
VVVLAVIASGLWWNSSHRSNGVADFRNATYSFDGVPVTLSDGMAQQPDAPGSSSSISTRIFGNETYGDFNGDGTIDVAFIITQTGGGSGTFYYIAAALNSDDGYRGTNATLLGDRIAPQSTEFMNGRITTNFMERAVGEAMTARPTVAVSKYFRVVNGRLVAEQ